MKKASFTTIGLIGKQGDPGITDTLRTLHTFLVDKGLRIIFDESCANTLKGLDLETANRSTIGEQSDLAIIVGGDGTLLNAVRSLADYDVPLVGINLGRIGFLADISPDTMLDYLGEILNGQYQIEERFLLHSTIMREGENISRSDAFNDVVIHKANVARMIELETYINDKYVNIQRLDGLIIATPTGSTAYALSAGGPILHPTLDAIVVAPVCPHTLSNRPLVVAGDNHIEVIVCDSNRDNAQITCDGQITFALVQNDRILIRKKEKPVRLIHPMQHDQFEILRVKLHWAEYP